MPILFLQQIRLLEISCLHRCFFPPTRMKYFPKITLFVISSYLSFDLVCIKLCRSLSQIMECFRDWRNMLWFYSALPIKLRGNLNWNCYNLKWNSHENCHLETNHFFMRQQKCLTFKMIQPLYIYFINIKPCCTGDTPNFFGDIQLVQKYHKVKFISYFFETKSP